MSETSITPDPLVGNRMSLADAEALPYNRVLWSVHGCVPDGGAIEEAGIYAEPIPADEQFPESEATDDIVSIRISCYGDDPDSAHVHVCGLTRQATEDCWRHICDQWVSPWPGRGGGA